MRTCTTHHYACDCREAEHTTQMALLKAENAKLRDLLEKVFTDLRAAAVEWAREYGQDCNFDEDPLSKQVVEALRGKSPQAEETKDG